LNNTPKRNKKNLTVKKPKIVTGSISFLPSIDFFTKSQPITLKISASEDDWRNLYFLLSATESEMIQPLYGYNNFVSAVKKICGTKRITGIDSIDKRKKKARENDELKKFIAAAYVFLEHWKDSNVDPPEEYKELEKSMKGKRLGLRTLLFRYCTAKCNLQEKYSSQKSFEYNFVDREKHYLDLVRTEAKRFADNNNSAFPSLNELVDILPERSAINFSHVEEIMPDDAGIGFDNYLKYLQKIGADQNSKAYKEVLQIAAGSKRGLITIVSRHSPEKD
jgi:hypothetical protein